MTELKRCPFCGGEATLVEDIYNDQLYNYVICSNDDCNANTGRCDTKDEALAKWNTRPNPWHTGTPTEKGLYVVLTKVSMKDVSSSEGTYILDYWDGYAFQYLKRKAMVYFPIAPDTYGWVKWQKIEEKQDGQF